MAGIACDAGLDLFEISDGAESCRFFVTRGFGGAVGENTAGFTRQPFEVFTLGEEVCVDAFATEDVGGCRTGACEGRARGEETKVAGREREEGCSAQASGLRAPGGFQEGAFVGGEECE